MEVALVAAGGNLPEILTPAPQGQVLSAQVADGLDEAINLMVLVEEVPSRALEGAERAAEHAFAQEDVAVSSSSLPLRWSAPLKRLLGAVVEAGNPNGGQVQAQAAGSRYR